MRLLYAHSTYVHKKWRRFVASLKNSPQSEIQNESWNVSNKWTTWGVERFMCYQNNCVWLMNQQYCWNQNQNVDRDSWSTFGGLIISVSLCMSPCSSDYIFNSLVRVALRLVSEDPINFSLDKSKPIKWFPADCLHRSDFHWIDQIETLSFKSSKRVLSDSQMFQHIAKCNLVCHQTRGQKILP